MNDRRVVIVGFMGCGKTTVAQALARRLACEMIDLDSFITNREGRSPAEIIQEDGEAAFRMIETHALQHALEQNGARVIALGGGAWIIEANRALVEKYDCLSVWLDAPFELCWQRITASGTNRPLAPDWEGARKLFETRGPLYGLAQVRIGRDLGAPEEIAIQVENYLK